jgi:hypothetical protein
MLQQTKTNGLLVPLRGYKVHVSGASMRGLSPQSWNAIKTFWAAYFYEAGAKLVEYDPHTSSSR